MLPEVTLAMEQRDADDRDSLIGRGAHGIARQDAQAPAVGREIGLNSNLHRSTAQEISNRMKSICSDQIFKSPFKKILLKGSFREFRMEIFAFR